MKGGTKMEKTEEEKKKLEDEAKEEVGKSEDAGKGDQPKTPSAIIDALAAAQRLEKATQKHKEQLDRQEDMIARKILSGSGGGHVETPELTPEEKKTAQAQEFFKDTALGDAISKVNEVK